MSYCAWYPIDDEWRGDEIYFATERKARDRADFMLRVFDARAVRVDVMPNPVTHRWQD
jgi:hypothetical protein